MISGGWGLYQEKLRGETEKCLRTSRRGGLSSRPERTRFREGGNAQGQGKKKQKEGVDLREGGRTPFVTQKVSLSDGSWLTQAGESDLTVTWN